MSYDRKRKLQQLEALTADLGLKPGDLMKSLREVRETRGRFLHELTDEQIDKQIADCEAAIARRRPGEGFTGGT